jgi:hypothetical protein
MPLAEFKPTILTGEQLQTYALDRVATVTALIMIHTYIHTLISDCNNAFITAI